MDVEMNRRHIRADLHKTLIILAKNLYGSARSEYPKMAEFTELHTLHLTTSLRFP